jgi:hypothetical protein
LYTGGEGEGEGCGVNDFSATQKKNPAKEEQIKTIGISWK